MYVHVPAAWSAMMAYGALATASLISFVWRHSLADSAARAFAIERRSLYISGAGDRQLVGQTDLGNLVQWMGA